MTAPIARAAYRRRAVDRPVAHRRSGIPTAMLGTLRIRNTPHVGETPVHGTSPHTIRLHRRPSMRRNARSAAHTRYRRSRTHRTTEKGAACRMRSPKIAPRPRTVGPRCKRAAIPNHPARQRTGGSRSPPVLHKNRPQSPPRRTSYRSRSPPASHASCPQTHGPADKRLQPGLPSPPQTHRPQAAAPTGRRIGRRLGRKIDPSPKSAPALRSPDEWAQKNGFRSTRKPFRSIFYSCVSVSGSATRMRPQYSQMIIFLPCRMSD